MEFLVVQTILEKQEVVNYITLSNTWANIIRKVIASNKEEALGKFLLKTKHIPAVEKLDPEILELNHLSEI